MQTAGLGQAPIAPGLFRHDIAFNTVALLQTLLQSYVAEQPTY